MDRKRYGWLVGTVAELGAIQIFYDDALVFLATTENEAFQALANSPYVLMGVSGIISLSLFTVLLAWALFDSGPLR